MMLAVILLSGCNVRNCDIVKKDGTKIHVWSGELLWIGEKKNVIANIDPNHVEFSVDAVSGRPDPNAIKAITDGVVKGLAEAGLLLK